MIYGYYHIHAQPIPIERLIGNFSWMYPVPHSLWPAHTGIIIEEMKKVRDVGKDVLLNLQGYFYNLPHWYLRSPVIDDLKRLLDALQGAGLFETVKYTYHGDEPYWNLRLIADSQNQDEWVFQQERDRYTKLAQNINLLLSNFGKIQLVIFADIELPLIPSNVELGFNVIGVTAYQQNGVQAHELINSLINKFPSKSLVICLNGMPLGSMETLEGRMQNIESILIMAKTHPQVVGFIVYCWPMEGMNDKNGEERLVPYFTEVFQRG